MKIRYTVLSAARPDVALPVCPDRCSCKWTIPTIGSNPVLGWCARCGKHLHCQIGSIARGIPGCFGVMEQHRFTGARRLEPKREPEPICIHRGAHGLSSAEAFNEHVPVGTAVRYFPIRGAFDHVETRTRSDAWTLGHGAVVVAIEGKAGGVLIDHLIIIEAK